jgi:metallo-beta-lactamase family protein
VCDHADGFSAKIQDRRRELIKTKRKVEGRTGKTAAVCDGRMCAAAMQQFASYSYEQWFHVHPNVRVMYRDAGHILGSATVNLEIKEGDRTIRLALPAISDGPTDLFSAIRCRCRM